MDCVKREERAKEAMQAQQFTIEKKDNEIKLANTAKTFLKEQVEVANDQKKELQSQIKSLKTKNVLLGSGMLAALVTAILIAL